MKYNCAICAKEGELTTPIKETIAEVMKIIDVLNSGIIIKQPQDKYNNKELKKQKGVITGCPKCHRSFLD